MNNAFDHSSSSSHNDSHTALCETPRSRWETYLQVDNDKTHANHHSSNSRVEPLYSEYWDIEYVNDDHGDEAYSYKIVSNKFLDLSYLLYPCGTPPPNVTTTFDAIVDTVAPVALLICCGHIDLPQHQCLNNAKHGCWHKVCDQPLLVNCHRHFVPTL